MSARTEPNPLNTYRGGPDERGHFGLYGGRFVAETLMPLILELEQAYLAAKSDPAFQREMAGHLKDYIGRLNRLRRENRQLKVEREILSKAAAWFARETNAIPSKGSSS